MQDFNRQDRLPTKLHLFFWQMMVQEGIVLLAVDFDVLKPLLTLTYMYIHLRCIFNVHTVVFFLLCMPLEHAWKEASL